MGKNSRKALNFRVGKLTNSIEKVSTGKSFKTDVFKVTPEDFKSITKKNK